MSDVRCPACHAPQALGADADGTLTHLGCATCGAVFAIADGLAPSAAIELDDAPPAPARPMPRAARPQPVAPPQALAPPDDARVRRMLVRGVLVALGVVAVVWWMRPRRVPWVPLVAAASYETPADVCAGKARCVTVYVAPWCHVCHEVMGLIRGMQARFAGSTLVGVRVVVGADDRASLEAMAKEIGGASFVDLDGSAWRASGTHAVPHWLVVDEDGKVLREMSGAYRALAPQLEALGLTD